MNLIVKKIIKKCTLKLSIFTIVVLSTFIFYNCNDIEPSLKNNESEILESLRNITSLKSNKIVNVSEFKDYHSYAKKSEYSEYAKAMHNAIVKINKDKKANKNEFKQIFLKEIEKIKKPICFNEEPSEIEIVNSYFDIIEDNICDDMKKDRLLYTIEMLSLIYNNFDNVSNLKSSKINSLSSIPILKSANEYGGVLLSDCQHECMESSINDMNWVNWVEAAIAPGPYFAWMLASCIYDCW
jgi:hypothetical protein